MNFQMLILFGIMVSHAQKEVDAKSKAAQNAVAVFAFFLFVVYGIFGGMLAVFRGEIIKTGSLYYSCICIFAFFSLLFIFA